MKAKKKKKKKEKGKTWTQDSANAESKRTLSDSDSSNSDSDESCDGEGYYSAFITIAHVESSEDLFCLCKNLENIVMKNP